MHHKLLQSRPAYGGYLWLTRSTFSGALRYSRSEIGLIKMKNSLLYFTNNAENNTVRCRETNAVRARLVCEDGKKAERRVGIYLTNAKSDFCPLEEPREWHSHRQMQRVTLPRLFVWLVG